MATQVTLECGIAAKACFAAIASERSHKRGGDLRCNLKRSPSWIPLKRKWSSLVLMSCESSMSEATAYASMNRKTKSKLCMCVRACVRVCVCACVRVCVCAWVADMQNTFRQVDTLCHGPQHVEYAKYVTIKEDQGTSMHKLASACLEQAKVTRPPVDWCSYVRSVHFLCACLVCGCK